MDYTKHFSTRSTPQTKAIPGKKMEPNNSGGFGFKVSPMQQLERFLILGTEGGSYYVTEKNLTVENAKSIVDLIANDGEAVVNKVFEISDQGRAPKNSPALFVLAMCVAPNFATIETRRRAFDLMPKIARTSTHLFEFIGYMRNFRGWGAMAQNGINAWYQDKDPNQLEYQMVKYRQRYGWTHNDVLRLTKPVPRTELHNQLYGFAKNDEIKGEHGFPLIGGYSLIKEATSAAAAARIVNDYRLPMEAIPTQFKKEPVVWEALLPHLPITATIRNLRNMAKSGFMAPMSDAAKVVAARISDPIGIKKGRVHPVQFLNALLNFPPGAPRSVDHGGNPSIHAAKEHSWLVDTGVVAALNEGFQSSFQTVTPSNKRFMLALDVSGSMAWTWCMGMNTITPREASAALALITANTEPNHFIGIFKQKFEQFTAIKAGMSLDDAIKVVSNIPFGGTNIASPIQWALANKLPIDMISCYTDNETYWRDLHPCQALQIYRDKMGINTKFISVSMCSNMTTVADPSDPGMLDIVGFDTATPKVISEFANM